MIQCIIGPPLEKQQKQEANHNQTEQMDLGIKYEKYLREVIQALETDEGFRKKLETADVEDIKTGKIAEQLQFVDHNIRSQLDELKREEVNRLRKYARQHKELSNGSDNVQFNGGGYLLLKCFLIIQFQAYKYAGINSNCMKIL